MLAMWRSICLAALAILVIVVTPASAHTPVPAIGSPVRPTDAPTRDSVPSAGSREVDVSRVSSEVPLSTAPILLLLLGATAIASYHVKPRRLFAAVLILGLAMFAFEAGVHSVHHLGQIRHADECLFASASAHLAALAPDAICLDVPAGATVFRQAESHSAPVHRPIAGQHQRAPPLSAS
jgi:hypothetical protein